jgi:hypothetical protein
MDDISFQIPKISPSNFGTFERCNARVFCNNFASRIGGIIAMENTMERKKGKSFREKRFIHKTEAS